MDWTLPQRTLNRKAFVRGGDFARITLVQVRVAIGVWGLLRLNWVWQGSVVPALRLASARGLALRIGPRLGTCWLLLRLASHTSYSNVVDST